MLTTDIINIILNNEKKIGFLGLLKVPLGKRTFYQEIIVEKRTSNPLTGEW